MARALEEQWGVRISMMIFYQELLSRSLSSRLIALALSKAGRISIALAIHSLDRRGSLSQSLFIPLIAPYILQTVLFKQTLKGSLSRSLALSKAGRISIAVIIHSFDRRGSLSHSLFTRLIAPYKSIAFLNQSVDHSVDRRCHFQKGWCAVRTLQIS